MRTGHAKRVVRHDPCSEPPATCRFTSTIAKGSGLSRVRVPTNNAPLTERAVPPRDASSESCDCCTAFRERRVMLRESGNRGSRANSAAVSAPVFSARGVS